ncbi:MAG: hypothetical protein ACLRPW_09675 [Intestinibacter sp.]
MFELLADGTVEYLCNKFKHKNITYGFGGIAALGTRYITSRKYNKRTLQTWLKHIILSRKLLIHHKLQI